MSKTSNFDIARMIASITGKTIEEFYDSQQEKVQTDIKVVNEETPNREELFSDPSPSRIDVATPKRSIPAPTEDLQVLLKTYGGEIVNNKILGGRQMTRAEYLKTKKSIKTVNEFWTHPLIYLMFRSEGQNIPSFVEWTTLMQMEYQNEE